MAGAASRGGSGSLQVQDEHIGILHEAQSDLRGSQRLLIAVRRPGWPRMAATTIGVFN
jgi:hypothetical protein